MGEYMHPYGSTVVPREAPEFLRVPGSTAAEYQSTYSTREYLGESLPGTWSTWICLWSCTVRGVRRVRRVHTVLGSTWEYLGESLPGAWSTWISLRSPRIRRVRGVRRVRRVRTVPGSTWEYLGESSPGTWSTWISLRSPRVHGVRGVHRVCNPLITYYLQHHVRAMCSDASCTYVQSV